MTESVYHLALSVSHNSSAALMRDGRIIVAACEERFCRQKNYVGYPKQSVDYCLAKAGITGAQLSRVAYTTVDNPGLQIKAKTTTAFSLRDYRDYYGPRYYQRKFRGEDTTDYLRWLRDDPQFNGQTEYFDFSYLTDDVVRSPELDFELFRAESARCLAQHLGIAADRVEFLDHHMCHAYYAYFGSPYRDKDCIALTLDGWGDGRNQTIWTVKDNRLTLIAESPQNDLGRIYKMATLLLAMRPDEHEFKVMGMAPYAKASHVMKAFATIANVCAVDGLRIVSKDRPADLYTYLKEAWEVHRFDNVAGAVQHLTEMTVRQLVANIVKETGISRFVLSGGIAMNIKMNQAIAEMDDVAELFVCGSGGDESLSIGGCYALNEDPAGNVPLHHLYLGFDAGDEAADFDPASVPAKFAVESGVSKRRVAQLILDGGIVGVIRGQAEFGARALGNRSILANPSVRESVQKINEAIKNRDFWMPFALSILEERHTDYIHNPKQLQSPHMSTSFHARLDRYREVEAGTHPYDKTVRPQFVSKEHAPAYHALISEFGALSGVPALLNTSFNLHGEPIVNTIADAIRTFDLSGLDHLYINDTHLLSKRPG